MFSEMQPTFSENIEHPHHGDRVVVAVMVQACKQRGELHLADGSAEWHDAHAVCCLAHNTLAHICTSRCWH